MFFTKLYESIPINFKVKGSQFHDQSELKTFQMKQNPILFMGHIQVWYYFLLFAKY